MNVCALLGCGDVKSGEKDGHWETLMKTHKKTDVHQEIIRCDRTRWFGHVDLVDLVDLERRVVGMGMAPGVR